MKAEKNDRNQLNITDRIVWASYILLTVNSRKNYQTAIKLPAKKQHEKEISQIENILCDLIYWHGLELPISHSIFC